MLAVPPMSANTLIPELILKFKCVSMYICIFYVAVSCQLSVWKSINCPLVHCLYYMFIYVQDMHELNPHPPMFRRTVNPQKMVGIYHCYLYQCCFLHCHRFQYYY